MVDHANDNPFDAPRQTIASYEALSGLRVALHDVAMVWAPFIPRSRFIHSAPICERMKQEGFEPACMNFEIDQLRGWLQDHPEGGIKVCHAGAVELAVPVQHRGALSAVLFAGVFHLGTRGSADLVDQQVIRHRGKQVLASPPKLPREQADIYLEGLRMLSARLRVWFEEHFAGPDEEPPVHMEREAERRRYMIEHYIAHHYTEPITLETLAKAINLSASRTAHLVTEVCGQSFGKLVARYRIQKAAAMLWQTQYSVTRIAMDCGYSDISNFHRAFKRAMSMTPMTYRKTGGIRSLGPEGLFMLRAT